MTEVDKKALTERIKEASPLELTVINFELLITHIDTAINAAPRSVACSKALKNAKDCLGVLFETLDMSVEFSFELADIYLFVNSILIRADFARTEDEKNGALNQARQIAEELKSSWQTLLNDPKLTSESKPKTPVYIGLTYGPNGQLNEYEDYDPNSGYKI
ncbi:MAG: flagellar protein FliS [Clostridiales bacterium]|nr:flagellar protein FliS [Clostridiales bacterium]